mmetsp:Transcript_12705/g.51031  ORF Transcript_12705/g.51031 Transcript_12705/m.51031 type:complete len:278 (-) Transcript_12705:919-1752(-)
MSSCCAAARDSTSARTAACPRGSAMACAARRRRSSFCARSRRARTMSRRRSSTSTPKACKRKPRSSAGEAGLRGRRRGLPTRPAMTARTEKTASAAPPCGVGVLIMLPRRRGRRRWHSSARSRRNSWQPNASRERRRTPRRRSTSARCASPRRSTTRGPPNAVPSRRQFSGRGAPRRFCGVSSPMLLARTSPCARYLGTPKMTACSWVAATRAKASTSTRCTGRTSATTSPATSCSRRGLRATRRRDCIATCSTPSSPRRSARRISTLFQGRRASCF